MLAFLLFCLLCLPPNKLMTTKHLFIPSHITCFVHSFMLIHNIHISPSFFLFILPFLPAFLQHRLPSILFRLFSHFSNNEDHMRSSFHLQAFTYYSPSSFLTVFPFLPAFHRHLLPSIFIPVSFLILKQGRLNLKHSLCISVFTVVTTLPRKEKTRKNNSQFSHSLPPLFIHSFIHLSTLS